MWEWLADLLSAADVSIIGERTSSWLGGAIVFGVMAAVIGGLWLLGRS